MVKTRRLLGKEEITFVDGTNREVELWAVPNFQMMKLRRLHRKTTIDKTGKGFDKVDFHDDEFMAAVLQNSLGDQLSRDELENDVESDITKLYNKYFNIKSREKKLKSSDTSNQEQEVVSEE